MITPVGEVRIARRYYSCPHCLNKSTPWDDWAGVGDDHLTPHTRRMAVLVGSSWSFDMASVRLKELCGVRISDDVIRKATHAAGRRAMAWQSRPEATSKVREASGHAEFYTDGTSVNTRSGWREIRLGVFAARPAGEAAPAAAWAKRKLPKPTARLAVASLQSAEAFSATWDGLVRSLQWDDGRSVTALADGAKWIWKRVAERLPRGECVLDVYHVSEHLHDCGRALHGDRTPAAREWADTRLLSLIEHGPIRFLEELEQERARLSGRSQAKQKQRAALSSLIQYLKPNVDGLWYASRLTRGLPIGSGLVEGAAKTIVGRRLKLNSARWHAAGAEPVAALCCLLYGDQWDTFWTHEAA